VSWDQVDLTGGRTSGGEATKRGITTANSTDSSEFIDSPTAVETLDSTRPGNYTRDFVSPTATDASRCKSRARRERSRSLWTQDQVYAA
jgi:hypothetical protein